MSKYRIPRKQRIQNRRTGSNLTTLTSLGGLAVGLFLAYLLGEILLYEQIHPIHWIVAVAGASLGYLVGIFLTLIKSAS